MPDRTPDATPGGPATRQSLRHWMLSLQPALAVFAQDILGHTTRIDLVARDEVGGVILVIVDGRLGDLPGSLEEPADAALLPRALAEAEWLQARLPDWAQLAPGLGLSSETAVRTWLVAPSFDLGTRATARALPDKVRLVEAQPAGLPLRIRFASEDTAPLRAAEAMSAPAPSPGEEREQEDGRDEAAGIPVRLAAARTRASFAAEEPGGGSFRSGLTEADLHLSSAERGEFEGA